MVYKWGQHGVRSRDKDDLYSFEELLENQPAAAWEDQIPDVIKGRAVYVILKSFVITRRTVETH